MTASRPSSTSGASPRSSATRSRAASSSNGRCGSAGRRPSTPSTSGTGSTPTSAPPRLSGSAPSGCSVARLPRADTRAAGRGRPGRSGPHHGRRRHPRACRAMTSLTLGIDLATASARCVVLDTETGSVVARADSDLALDPSASRVACRARTRRMRGSPSDSSGRYASSWVRTPVGWPRCRSPAPPGQWCRSTETGRRSVPLASTTTPRAPMSWPQSVSRASPLLGGCWLSAGSFRELGGPRRPTSSTPPWPVVPCLPTPRTGSRPGSTSPLGIGRSTR